jgi:putative DNA primase/helicase
MEQEFNEVMVSHGVVCKEAIIADGEVHRFASSGRGRKDAWYVSFGKAGAFGDWRREINEKWSVRNDHLSFKEKEDLRQQIEKAKEKAEQIRLEKHNETALVALAKWDSFSQIGTAPYLERKKVHAFGVHFARDTIVVPLKDITGKLWSLQWINQDGTKRFLAGGRKKSCFHQIGTIEEGKPIYVTEGYATGASVYMATQQTTVIAFDAGNLDPVIEALKQSYPKNPLIIAGDDDCWKDHNTGREKAEEATRKYGCRVVFPAFKDTSTKPTDFNDLMLLEGQEEVNRQLNDVLKATTVKALNLRELLLMEIPPREMIIDPIIPEQGLVMIHAPRGIGKTQVSLMIAYTVATGYSMFDSKWHSPNPQKVLFVDGEMPLTALQERLARIVQSIDREPTVDDQLMIITQDIQDKGLSDLSTPEGQRVIEEHLIGVKLLILDNYSSLCRSGRENEAESWVPLQEWFLKLRRRGISVLLIHHSNKNGGQRGTSRKEDLLDTVITLRKPENYDPKEGARFEVHYEKARGFYGDEAAPFEAHLQEHNGKLCWRIQKLEQAQLKQVLALHQEGFTQREIADELGLGLGTVNRKLKEAKENGNLTI